MIWLQEVIKKLDKGGLTIINNVLILAPNEPQQTDTEKSKVQSSIFFCTVSHFYFKPFAQTRMAFFLWCAG